MKLCSEGHEDVCYEGKLCPACAAIARLTDEIARRERIYQYRLATIEKEREIEKLEGEE